MDRKRIAAGLGALVTFGKPGWKILKRIGDLETLLNLGNAFGWWNVGLVFVGVCLALFAFWPRRRTEEQSVNPEVAEAKAVKTTANGLVIHSAIYGALGEYREVTPQVQEHVADDALDILVHAGTMKCDPSHNKPKFLWVNYSFAAKTIHRTRIPEGERLKLNDSRIPEDPEIWEMDQEQHKFLETQARFEGCTVLSVILGK